MNKIEHKTKDGNSIVIFDNLFDYSTRNLWFQTLYNSAFSFSISYDSQLSDFKSVSAIGNHWSETDWDNFGFPRHPNWHHVQKELGERSYKRGWLNVNTGKELYRWHSDHENVNAKSILFYPNLKWDSEWDGQTVFKNKNLDQYEMCIDYVPGRLVVFDSIIPHKAIHSNHESSDYRMIINAVYF